MQRKLGVVTLVNASWSLIGFGLDVLISFILTIFIARPLGPAQYGYIPLVTGVTDIIKLVLVTTIGTSMAKFIAPAVNSKTGEVQIILRAGFDILICLSFLVAVLVFVFSGLLANIFGKPEMENMFRIAALTLMANGMFAFVQSAFQGLGRLDLFSFSQISYSILRLTTSLFFFYELRWQVEGVLFATAVSFFVPTLLFFIVLWKNWFRFRAHPDVESYIKIIKYASPLFGSSIAFYAYTRIDLVILGYYIVDKSQVGILGMATAIFSIFLLVAQSISTSAFPAVSRLSASNDLERLQRLFDLSTYWLLVFTIPSCIGVYVLIPQLTTQFLPGYSGIVPILFIISPLIILRSLGMICAGGFLTPSGHARDVARLTTFAAIVNVILDLLLIPIFAAKGSAVGTLIVHGSVAVISLVLVSNQLKIRFKLPWEIVYSSLAMIAIILTMNIINPNKNWFILNYISGFLFFISIIVFKNRSNLRLIIPNSN